MAYVPASASAEIAKYARTVLRAHFGEGRKRKPNIHRATRTMSEHEPRSRAWEADRKLLRRIVVRRSGTRFRDASVARLRILLQRVQPDAAIQLNRLAVSTEARRVLRKVRDNHRWADRPTAMDVGFIKAELERLAQEELLKGGRLRPNTTVLGLLDRFRRWGEKQGHEQWRIDLSEANILAHVVRYWSSGGIERGWHELSAKEKVDAVRALIKAEKIWLNRAPNGIRARESYPPGEYASLLELMGDDEIIWSPAPEAGHLPAVPASGAPRVGGIHNPYRLG